MKLIDFSSCHRETVPLLHQMGDLKVAGSTSGGVTHHPLLMMILDHRNRVLRRPNSCHLSLRRRLLLPFASRSTSFCILSASFSVCSPLRVSLNNDTAIIQLAPRSKHAQRAEGP